MTQNKKVLLINTHLNYPNFSEGALNGSLQTIAKDFFQANGFEILETKVEDGYDANQEVEKHLAAAIIILQTPINWFGPPWIYKKYADEVFNSGRENFRFLNGDGRTRADLTKQYGTGGNLQDKKFMVSATWNAPRASFDDPAQYLFEGKSTADVLIAITANYRFCGAEVVDDFNCFDIFKDGNVKSDLEKYPFHLRAAFNL